MVAMKYPNYKVSKFIMQNVYAQTAFGKKKIQRKNIQQGKWD